MRQQHFEARHQASWAACEAQLGQMGRGDRPPAAVSTEDFPEQYRRLCHHLSLARERAYAPALVQHLHELALRGHQVLYGARAGLGGRWAAFLRADFPRRVRNFWPAVLLASTLFGLPFLGLPFAVQREPEVAYLVETPQSLARYEAMYRGGPEGKMGRENQSDTDLAMFGHYIWNNIRITFQAFATGILAGLGPVFFLFWNGVHGGAVAGHLMRVGLGGNFGAFIITHGALELPALVLAGAAGLQLGWSILAPGRRSRAHALKETTRAVAPLVYGAAAMDVLAALLEAFWSASAAVPPVVKVSVGGTLWGLVLLYFALAGRRWRRA